MAADRTRPGRYVASLADRLSPGSGGSATKAMLWSLTALPIGGMAGGQLAVRLGVADPLAVIGAGLVGAVAGYLAVLGLTLGLSNGAARIVGGTLMPSGKSTPYQHDFSLQESFVARGEFRAAEELYEDAIREQPGDVEVRVRAAELYMRPGGDAMRAAALWREVQRLPNAPPSRVLHATQRLIDLYLGPLAEPRRALVELRRLVDSFPNAPAAAHAREALARLKAEHLTDGSG